jgi:hypothetical protein
MTTGGVRWIVNLTDKPIRWAFVTQAHGDDYLGNQVLKEAGAIIVGQNDVSRSRSGTTSMQRAAFMGGGLRVPGGSAAPSRRRSTRRQSFAPGGYGARSCSRLRPLPPAGHLHR